MRRLVNRLSGRVSAFTADASGTVAIMGVCVMMVALALAAIVTDWGGLYLNRRDQQGITDLAALVAARNMAKPTIAANTIVADNNVPTSVPADVILGNYSPDRTLAPTARFVANRAPFNAVQVTVSSDRPMFFGRMFAGKDTIPVVTTATAATTSLAAIGIGSRLASLNGGILNAILGDTLGGSVSLSLADYNSLADARVDLFKFSDQLATTAHLTGPTYNDVLNNNVTVGQVLSAMAASGPTGSSPSTAKAAITKLGNTSNAAHMTIPAGQLLDLGPYGALTVGEGSGLVASARALEIINAAAAIANGTHQVDFSLGTSIPGVADLSVSLVIGEPMQHTPWLAVGDTGTTVYTAQARVRINATVGGTGLLSAAQIKVPILADIAWARASIANISCGDNPSADASVDVTARSGVADLWIGDPTSWTNFSQAPTVGPGTLVNVPLLAKVTGTGHASISNVADKTVTFSASDIAAHRIKSISTTTPVTSLIASTLGDTTLNVSALGLGVGTGTVTSLVQTALAGVGPAVDPVLIQILDALGVKIGEADVEVDGVRCDGSVLVN